MKETKQHTIIIRTACLLLSLLLAACILPACGEPELWDHAVYTEDTVLGTGAKTITVTQSVGEHIVVFTLHTDAATLGEVLLAHDLIAGEAGAYGIYVKKVNGITADYDIDGSYWGFYKSGDYLMQGVDTTPIADGEAYEIIYEK